MTDRIAYLTVALDSDYRIDDVECIVNAITQLKGVSGVEPGKADNIHGMVERARVRNEIAEAVWRVAKDGPVAAAKHILGLEP